MEKTLKYLSRIKESIYSKDNLELSHKLFLIHEKSLFINRGWEYYFRLTVQSESEDYLNSVIKVGTFVSIHSLADRIFNWSNRRITYQKGGRVHLIGLLRNHITHGSKDFYLPGWWGDEDGLTQLGFVHVDEINTIEGLSDWLSYFEETNKESWWDEEWATSSKNQIIQDALHIHKIDLEKVDNELLKMVSDYFNNFLN